MKRSISVIAFLVCIFTVYAQEFKPNSIIFSDDGGKTWVKVFEKDSVIIINVRRKYLTINGDTVFFKKAIGNTSGFDVNNNRVSAFVYRCIDSSVVVIGKDSYGIIEIQVRKNGYRYIYQ